MGIKVDADARIFYVHMDDLKRCDPSPTGSDSPPMAMSDQSTKSDDCGDGDARAPPITVHTENSAADTGAPSKTIWDLPR